MSTEITKQALTLDKFNELKDVYLTSLKKDFFLNSYEDLLNTINSLISISQNAIEGITEHNIPHCNAFDIANTLEIAKQLLPYSESEFLDLLK